MSRRLYSGRISSISVAYYEDGRLRRNGLGDRPGIRVRFYRQIPGLNPFKRDRYPTPSSLRRLQRLADSGEFIFSQFEMRGRPRISIDRKRK